MANSHVQLGGSFGEIRIMKMPVQGPGLVVLTFVGAILGLAIWGLLQGLGYHGQGQTFAHWGAQLLSSRVVNILQFSLLQASLSTLGALLMGALMALALHRRRFWGRGLLISLLSASFVLPPVVAVTGLISVFGRQGWLTSLWDQGLGMDELGFGLGPWLYGLPGILIAHIFFNAAFCAHLFLAQIEAIPANQWRQAYLLNLRPWALFRLLDWPALRPAIAGLTLLVFLLCFTSFAIVLTLGGGPKASTLEVAIYEALKTDFDIGLACTLALLQALIGLMVWTALRFRPLPWPANADHALKGDVQRPDHDHFATRVLDALTTVFCFVLILLPCLALINRGFQQIIKGHGLDSALLKASLTSLSIASLASALSLAIGFCAALAIRQAALPARREAVKGAYFFAGTAQALPHLILVLPMFVLSTGLFIALRPLLGLANLVFPLLVLINALMALPFVMAQLSPALIAIAKAHDRKAQNLNLHGWRRMIWIDLPLARPAFARAMGYAMALSLGDLGIVALFGSQDVRTLPLLLYQRMGSYRFDEAMATALVLVVLVISLFALSNRLAYPLTPFNKSRHARL